MWDSLFLPVFYPLSIVEEVDKIVKFGPPKYKIDHFVMALLRPFEDNVVIDHSRRCLNC